MASTGAFSSEFSPIYQAFFESCPPYRIPDPFDYCHADPYVRACPSDGPLVLQRLQKRFGPEALVATHLAARRTDGSLGLHPGLATPGAPLIALCASQDAAPFEFLTDAGCLRSTRLPALTVFGDAFTVARLCSPVEGGGAYPPLFVCADLATVVLFRAAGLPAVTPFQLTFPSSRVLDALERRFGTGFNQRPSPEVFNEQLRSIFGDDYCCVDVPPLPTLPTRDQAADADVDAEDERCQPEELQSVHLGLVGWNPLKLEQATPKVIQQAADYFHTVQTTFLDRRLKVFLWVPQACAVKSLRFAQKHRDVEWVRKSLWTGFKEGGAKPVFSFRPQDYFDERPAPHYGPSVFKWLQATLLPDSCRRPDWQLRDMRDRVLALLESEVVAPLAEQARTTREPTVRILLHFIAELSRIAHSEANDIALELLRKFLSPGLPFYNDLVEPQFKVMLANVRTIIALAKEVRSWKQRSRLKRRRPRSKATAARRPSFRWS